jgi:hypothetical protein
MKKKPQLGAEAHSYNPSYSGRSQFEASLGKQFMKPYLKTPNTETGFAEWPKW